MIFFNFLFTNRPIFRAVLGSILIFPCALYGLEEKAPEVQTHRPLPSQRQKDPQKPTLSDLVMRSGNMSGGFREEREAQKKFLKDIQHKAEAPLSERMQAARVFLWQHSEDDLEDKQDALNFFRMLQQEAGISVQTKIEIAQNFLSPGLFEEEEKERQLSFFRNFFHERKGEEQDLIRVARFLASYEKSEDETRTLLKYLEEALRTKRGSQDGQIDIAIAFLFQEKNAGQKTLGRTFLFSFFKEHQDSLDDVDDVLYPLLHYGSEEQKEEIYSFLLNLIKNERASEENRKSAASSLSFSYCHAPPQYQLQGYEFLLALLERENALFFEEIWLQQSMNDLSYKSSPLNRRLCSLLCSLVQNPEASAEDLIACIEILNNIAAQDDITENKEEACKGLLLALEKKAESFCFERRLKIAEKVFEFGNTFQRERCARLLKSFIRNDASFSEHFDMYVEFIHSFKYTSFRHKSSLERAYIFDISLFILERRGSTLSFESRHKFLEDLKYRGTPSQKERCCHLFLPFIEKEATPTEHLKFYGDFVEQVMSESSPSEGSQGSLSPVLLSLMRNEKTPLEIYKKSLRLLCEKGTLEEKKAAEAHFFSLSFERRLTVIRDFLASITEKEINLGYAFLIMSLEDESTSSEDLEAYVTLIQDILSRGSFVARIQNFLSPGSFLYSDLKSSFCETLLKILKNSKTSLEAWDICVRNIFQFGELEQKKRVGEILNENTSPDKLEACGAYMNNILSGNSFLNINTSPCCETLLNILRIPNTSLELWGVCVRNIFRFGELEQKQRAGTILLENALDSELNLDRRIKAATRIIISGQRRVLEEAVVNEALSFLMSVTQNTETPQTLRTEGAQVLHNYGNQIQKIWAYIVLWTPLEQMPLASQIELHTLITHLVPDITQAAGENFARNLSHCPRENWEDQLQRERRFLHLEAHFMNVDIQTRYRVGGLIQAIRNLTPVEQNNLLENSILVCEEYLRLAREATLTQEREMPLPLRLPEEVAFEIHNYSNNIHRDIVTYLDSQLQKASYPYLSYEEAMRTIQEWIRTAKNIQAENQDVALQAIVHGMNGPESQDCLRRCLTFVTKLHPDTLNVYMNGFITESITAYLGRNNPESCAKGVSERALTGLRGTDESLEVFFHKAEALQSAKAFFAMCNFGYSEEKNHWMVKKLLELGITVETLPREAAQRFGEYANAHIRSLNLQENESEYLGQVVAIVSSIEDFYDYLQDGISQSIQASADNTESLPS
ncbi:MAG: hypothetical protein B7Y25_00620 [Alphaproteobacteria bacterium 16-39-46]|nr:MAG: hypothetical protein B7Y25_00620 [Alphaproteobacteria bacterium 16-39-46]OZA44343.1 MAG: hypothetical protein B7X84_00625 [Alphaproteobacteria bacterium 17-39-52]HQS83413.1 hypothetical protein [Alphaproteobacteria bacterium]HQS93177.1 hypothetical protein [Alphaproteobacteria bacterium]